MTSPNDKGNFQTDISQDVIRQALESVKRPTGEHELPVEVPVEVSHPGVESSGRDQEVAELQAQLELSQAKGREMMEKLRDSHDRMVRSAADLDNYRKRAAKEKEEIQKYGAERLLKDFLPISDNLDRALEHARTAADFDSLKQGLQMTRKLFEDTLGRHGVKSFETRGKPFDPRFHEAIQQVETSEIPAHHVVMEVVRGYTLNERLVRPALVTVAVPVAQSDNAVVGGDKKDA